MHVQTVFHTYDYLDFKPYIPESVTFEPSYMLPGGKGCVDLNLNCDIDVKRKGDKTKAAQARMFTERVEVDIDRAIVCKETDFVPTGRSKAVVGLTGVHFSIKSPKKCMLDSVFLFT
jgi:hypothetical protein